MDKIRGDKLKLVKQKSEPINSKLKGSEYGVLMCLDCMTLFNELEDNSIDLIVTDPPYRTTSRGNAGNSGGMLQKDINKKGQVFKYNDIDCTVYVRDFYRVLKEGSHCYVMTNHTNLIHMLNTFTTDLRTDEEKAKGVKPYSFHFIKSLIWDKGNKIMGQYYMSQFEYILFLRKGKGVKINNCGTSDILRVPNKKTKDLEGNNLHDTEKPEELMRILIENSSQEGDTVLDPFCGIAPVQRACFKAHRKFLCCDIDQHSVDIANRLFKEELQCKTQPLKSISHSETNQSPSTKSLKRHTKFRSTAQTIR